MRIATNRRISSFEWISISIIVLFVISLFLTLSQHGFLLFPLTVPRKEVMSYHDILSLPLQEESHSSSHIRIREELDKKEKNKHNLHVLTPMPTTTLHPNHPHQHDSVPQHENTQPPQQQHSNHHHHHVVFLMVGAVRYLERTHASILHNLMQPLCPPTDCTSHLITHFSYTDNRPDKKTHDPIGTALSLGDETFVKNMQSNIQSWLCTKQQAHLIRFQSCQAVTESYNIGSQEEQQAMDTYERELLEQAQIKADPNDLQKTHILVHRIRSLRYGDPRRYSMWFARYWTWRYVSSTYTPQFIYHYNASSTVQYMFVRPDLLWYLPFMTQDFLHQNTRSNHDVWVHDTYYSSISDTFAFLPNAQVAQTYFSIEFLVHKNVACFGGPDFNMSLAKERLISKNLFDPLRDADIPPPDKENSKRKEIRISPMVVAWCGDFYSGWSEQILQRKFHIFDLKPRYVPAAASLFRTFGPDCQPIQAAFITGYAKHFPSPIPYFVCLLMQRKDIDQMENGDQIMDLIHAIRPFRIHEEIESTTCLTQISSQVTTQEDQETNTSTDDSPYSQVVAIQKCQEHPTNQRQVFSSFSNSSGLLVLWQDDVLVENTFPWNTTNHNSSHGDLFAFDRNWKKKYFSLYTPQTLQPKPNEEKKETVQPTQQPQKSIQKKKAEQTLMITPAPSANPWLNEVHRKERCTSSLYTTRFTSEKPRPLPVFFIPESIDYGCELTHYLKEGVEKSPCFYHEKNGSNAAIWVIDRHRIESCESLEANFTKEMDRRLQASNHDSSWNEEENFWRVYFVDFVDRADLRPCDNILDLIQDWAKDIIHVKRSTVTGRNQSFASGRIKDYQPHRVIHIPYGVRSDLVALMNAYVTEILRQTGGDTMISNDPQQPISKPICPVDLSGRTTGVRYFWHHPLQKCKNVLAECENSAFRATVSEALLRIESNISAALEHESSHATNGDKVTYPLKIGLSGAGIYQGELGRNTAHRPYAVDLASSRIVVVTQRDFHEDHYRLMEAFVGGALVMTDFMVVPPKRLVDGEHYVVYRSLNELGEKIVFYLSNEAERKRVAFKGWKQVMQYYRSWGLMESILLRHEEP